VTLSE